MRPAESGLATDETASMARPVREGCGSCRKLLKEDPVRECPEQRVGVLSSRRT